MIDVVWCLLVGGALCYIVVQRGVAGFKVSTSCE